MNGRTMPAGVVISGDIAAGKTTLRKREYATGYVLIGAVDIILSLCRGEYVDLRGPLEEPRIASDGWLRPAPSARAATSS